MRKHISKPAVFISCSTETLSLAHVVAQESTSFANPMVWSEAMFEVSSPITAQLSTALSRCDFAICLMHDYSMEGGPRTRPERAQANVIFELGFIAGALGVDRLLIVTIGREPHTGPPLPSDIVGLTHLALPWEAIDKQTSSYAHRVVNEGKRVLRRVEPRPEQLASSFSCLISYVHEDRLFASRLHKDLTEIGVRCWVDAHEVRMGDSLIDSIEGGLRATDRMVVVLSSHAVDSHWLITELQLALELEKQRSSKVVLPVRLDNSVFDGQGPLWASVQSRDIADFSAWTDPPKYKRAFASLARELTLSVAAQESAP